MKYLIISAFIALSIGARAQTEKIDEICTSYDKIISSTEEAEEAAPRMKVTTNLTKRAIGPVSHEITIYFDEHEMIIEGGEEEDTDFHKEAVIRKVEFRISSVSYTMDYSYYFDEGGILIKYALRNIGYSCYLKQVYFSGKSASRIKLDPITNEDCKSEDNPKGYDHKELTKDEKAGASWLMEDANTFRQLLFLNYQLIKN